MYLPAHFTEIRADVLQECIARHPFGVLVTHGSTGLDANHIPFELATGEGPLGTLHAHVARNNPLWQDVADGAEVLVVFTAGDAYVSPNWYPTKHETQRQVPTWNYIVVHAHGRVHFHHDERVLRGVVARLTRTQEAAQPEPWKMTDAPADYIGDLLARIVGVSVEITRLVGKSKLGQDEVARDIQGAGEALKAQGRESIGKAMLAHLESRRE